MYQDITERYITASNATSLVADADSVRGNVDVLIAAGWSKSTLGLALLRLISEYDATGKRRGVLRQQIAAEKSRGGLNIFAQLRSLNLAITGVEAYAAHHGIEQPHEKSIAVVLHWLDNTCKTCDGTKYQRIADTPYTSSKVCKCCRGAGVVGIPFYDDGKRLANYMDDCLHSARISFKKRLHRA